MASRARPRPNIPSQPACSASWSCSRSTESRCKRRRLASNPRHTVSRGVVEGLGIIAYLGRQIIGRVNAFEGVAEDLFAAALP